MKNYTEEALYSTEMHCFICRKSIGFLVTHVEENLKELKERGIVRPACHNCKRKSVVRTLKMTNLDLLFAYLIGVATGFVTFRWPKNWTIQNWMNKRK